MSPTVHTIIVIVALGGSFGWLMVYTIRRAEEPGWMVLKWVVTIIVACLMYW